MDKMITEQEEDQALRSGLCVRYNADGKPIRILSREETEKAKQNWDEEYCCPKKLGELFRKVRADIEQKKVPKEPPSDRG